MTNGREEAAPGTEVAAIYVRSDEKDAETHEGILRAVCVKRGWKVHGVYSDRGMGGMRRFEWFDPNGTSAGLGRLIKDGFHRPYGIVLVWRFSRLAVTMLGLLDIRDELAGMGVRLVSYLEDADLSTVTGKAVFNILAALAEFEHNRYSDLCGGAVR